jgi:hypothetical protein
MNPKVFILILNWNGKNDTLECLNSLKKITYKNYKIVIVDNGSKDDSVREIKKNFPNVKIIQNHKNLGFAEGSNVGIRYALKNKADYVLLLNNDTIVDRKFLSEMIKVAESDEKIGIVCSKVYFYSKPRVLQYAGLKFNFKKGKSILLGYNEKDIGQFDKIREADFCGGACMLVKKDVFEKIGLFDKNYFAYFEDNDFGFRARNEDYKIALCLKAKIWHKVSASSGGQSNPFKEYYMNRNRIIFMKKYSTNWQFSRFLVYFCFESIIASAMFLKMGIFDMLKSKIKGIFNGVKWKNA